MAIAVQIVGALLLLGGFALTQTGRWTAETPAFRMVNLVGATILAGSAFVNEQWGFVLLNVCWVLVAAVGLVAGGRSGRS